MAQQASLVRGGVWAAAAAPLLLLLLGGTSLAQMHTTVESFDDSCDAQLQALWSNYTAPPVAPVAGCNATCLSACYDTLNWALYSEKMQNCPHQDDIIRCMHVYRAQWTKFVDDCALFEYGVSGGAEAEGEAGGSSSSSSESAAEGEAATPSGEAGEASSTPTGEASEASSTPSSEASEAAAAQATSSAGEAEAEAQAGRRRVLLQEAEAALGEGGGGSTYGGCFPLFANSTQFEQYLNGEFQFDTSSAAVGITLSVLFYVSLLLLGLGLPTFIRQPLRKLGAKIKAKLTRRKTPKLTPPSQPLAEDAAAAAVAKPASEEVVPAGFPPAAAAS